MDTEIVIFAPGVGKSYERRIDNMRAICCAILALVVYVIGAIAANSERGYGVFSGMHIMASYVFIGFAIYLCIAGL